MITLCHRSQKQQSRQVSTRNFRSKQEMAVDELAGREVYSKHQSK